MPAAVEPCELPPLTPDESGLSPSLVTPDRGVRKMALGRLLLLLGAEEGGGRAGGEACAGMEDEGEDEVVPGKGGGYFGILGISGVGSGREKGGRVVAAGRRAVKLDAPASMTATDIGLAGSEIPSLVGVCLWHLSLPTVFATQKGVVPPVVAPFWVLNFPRSFPSRSFSTKAAGTRSSRASRLRHAVGTKQSRLSRDEHLH
jgi:hypothetical protein